uniref:NADH dehydrogenase [ubiquinone] 1 beta subcomplex subunit 1 n=1 Tax=Rhinolophus ferrumequinum TaxID=59479 RepID=A0A671E3H7_RHIFE
LLHPQLGNNHDELTSDHVCNHSVHIFTPVGFVFGYYLDIKNYEKFTDFWNNSMLFKRELRPNEEIIRKYRVWLNYRIVTFYKL